LNDQFVRPDWFGTTPENIGIWWWCGHGRLRHKTHSDLSYHAVVKVSSVIDPWRGYSALPAFRRPHELGTDPYWVKQADFTPLPDRATYCRSTPLKPGIYAHAAPDYKAMYGDLEFLVVDIRSDVLLVVAPYIDKPSMLICRTMHPKLLEIGLPALTRSRRRRIITLRSPNS
jgi:hypothetical protein